MCQRRQLWSLTILKKMFGGADGVMIRTKSPASSPPSASKQQSSGGLWAVLALLCPTPCVPICKMDSAEGAGQGQKGL